MTVLQQTLGTFPARAFLAPFAGAFLILALLGLPGGAAAETPSSFIERLGGDAIGALENEELTAEQRMESFQAVLDAGFDIDGMGRFVLGRYWRTASQPERDEYMALFRERVILTFAARLGNFTGQDFKIIDSRPQSADVTVVESTLTLMPLPPIGVDWHVRGTEPDFKVVDVIVQGLSEIQTQRNSFSAAIQCSRDGLQALLAQLRQNPTATPVCSN
ncbi:MAG: ABC transporter substrate-binding protein [Proteobacteria bacterium]|nr:ABC transporter substrate-binding protein [Pseudomonadota bacterium]